MEKDAKKAAEEMAAQVHKARDFEAKAAAPETYTVKAGDTLTAIAEKYFGPGASYDKIFEANKDILDSPDDIKVGQELKIPKS